MPPREPMRSAMLTMEVVLAIEALAGDTSQCPGVRYMVSALMLMVLASLRHAEAKAVRNLRITNAAARGRSRDLNRRGRPIISRAAALAGAKSQVSGRSPFSSLGRIPP